MTQKIIQNYSLYTFVSAKEISPTFFCKDFCYMLLHIVTIIWAYNKTYPVAKIVSGSDITISVTLRNSINNHSYCGTDIKSSVDADITFLAGELNAYITSDIYQVTLFTYKPLIGLTSQTDTNGKTTYY